MSTRGFISFVVDGETKTAYNHSDSYPDYLGANVLDWARAADIEAAAVAARALRVIGENDEPTARDIEHLAPYTNRNVGGRSDSPTWYQLLRETQGSPAAMLAAGVIEDGSSFPADSLFAEWGYVVDFDAKAFEVYVGFQRGRHSDGRFASMTPNRDGYYPVRLIKSWPLDDLPSTEAFVTEADGSDEDAEQVTA